jgi:DNA-binding NarL/FixJ family response regulator
MGAVGRLRPDVVLIDIRTPRFDGLAATAEIRSWPQPPAVVVLTTFDTDDAVFRALEVGATGFLLKDTPPEELLRAVRHAASGDSMLSPAVTRRVITRFTAEDRSRRRREALERLSGLTGREVLVQIGLGQANAEIARNLHVSETRVCDTCRTCSRGCRSAIACRSRSRPSGPASSTGAYAR